MTLIVTPISGETIDELRDAVTAAVNAGADAIELRIDLTGPVTTDEVRTLRQNTSAEIPFILTIRSAAEGGQWDGGDDDRVSRLIELGPFAEYIDVELELWRRSANIRQKIGLALRRADHVSQSGGQEEIEFGAARKLILSKHDMLTRPKTLHADLVEMVAEPTCAVPKLAWRARTTRDNFEALELMRESPKPGIFICMGAEGLMSRVLARKFGAFASFAALKHEMGTAPGQATLSQMKSLYRWDAIDGQTQVYGVVGDPVTHSLSPAVHNAAFAHAKINAVYLPLPVFKGYESFKAFMVEALARPWLDLRGLSVTIPHKENAYRFLSECSAELDDTSRKIGAVNTIAIDSHGAIRGYNTDAPAARDCISQVLADRATEPGRTAMVLGAGGVARAVTHALRTMGWEVSIFNRTEERARELAHLTGSIARPWAERLSFPSDLIVNCTSVGLWPNAQESPLPSEALKSKPAVFDTVYRPLDTTLLVTARNEGCPTIDGLEMFIRQADAQFQIWTQQTGANTVIRQAAVRELAKTPEIC